jgi:hypothetical protein
MLNDLVHIVTTGLEIVKIMVFWNLILCTSVDRYQGFGETVHQSQDCECGSTLQIEAENFSKMIVPIHQTAWQTHP